MTLEEKIEAMVESGFADDKDDAVAQLADMGEEADDDE